MPARSSRSAYVAVSPAAFGGPLLLAIFWQPRALSPRSDLDVLSPKIQPFRKSALSSPDQRREDLGAAIRSTAKIVFRMTAVNWRELHIALDSGQIQRRSRQVDQRRALLLDLLNSHDFASGMTFRAKRSQTARAFAARRSSYFDLIAEPIYRHVSNWRIVADEVLPFSRVDAGGVQDIDAAILQALRGPASDSGG